MLQNVGRGLMGRYVLNLLDIILKNDSRLLDCEVVLERERERERCFE